MSVKPAHFPVGRLVETLSTSSVDAGQFIWKSNEFQITSSVIFRAVVFSDDSGTVVSASLSTIGGTEIALLTSNSTSPVSLTTTVDLLDDTIYEIKVTSDTEGNLVTLGSAELEIS